MQNVKLHSSETSSNPTEKMQSAIYCQNAKKSTQSCQVTAQGYQRRQKKYKSWIKYAEESYASKQDTIFSSFPIRLALSELGTAQNMLNI